MKKNVLFGFLGIGLLVGAFFGGIMYQKNKMPVRNLSGNFGRGIGSNGQLRNSQGNFIGGEIIAKDEISFTVKVQNGSSRIVLFSPETQILKPTLGTDKDLILNANVMVNGTTNSDGSFSAQSVQLRPEIANTKK